MKRLTISLPDVAVEKAQRAVRSGDAESVSGYFAGLAEREPDWAAARAAVDELVTDIGGVPDDARQWARRALGQDGDTGVA